MLRRTAARLGPMPILLLSLCVLPITNSNAMSPRDHDTVRALFFGDSLMAGVGAQPTRPVMARVAARALGWDITVDAWGGTGYTTGGRRGKPYLQRLSAPGLLSPRYDVVLLAGGTNDRAADLAIMRERTEEAVRYVRQRLPSARIVLMGAFNPRSREYDARRVQIDGVIADVAHRHSLPFVSPISGRWAQGQPARFLSRDGLHPSAYGYAVMGGRLVVALRAADVAHS